MERRDFLKLSGLFMVSIPGVGNVNLSRAGIGFRDDRFWKDVEKRIVDFQLKFRGKDLSKHPAIVKPNNITHSFDFFKVCVAREWGCEPSKIDDMSYDDNVNVFAWYVATQQIKIVESYFYNKCVKERDRTYNRARMQNAERSIPNQGDKTKTTQG